MAPSPVLLPGERNEHSREDQQRARRREGRLERAGFVDDEVAKESRQARHDPIDEGASPDELP